MNGPTPNVVQIQDWDGPLGQRWAADAERLDRMSREFGELIVEKLAPQRGDRILDIGCGNGALAGAAFSSGRTRNRRGTTARRIR